MIFDSQTKVFASIAYPNKSALSPRMYNAAFKQLNINSVYLCFEPKNIKDAIYSMRTLNINGYSISKPYKQEVIQYLDEIDPVAQSIGAVNVVHNQDGKLVGYNSDWLGAVNALAEKTEIKGKDILMIGSGGVAFAIAYGLKLKGADVVIYNRTLDNAKKLSKRFDVLLGGNINDLKNAKKPEIIINATSVGSQPLLEENLIPDVLINSKTVVMDVVFNPRETPLIKIAKRKNCKTVDGVRMLVLQGVFTFELFTQRKAPVELMYETVIKSTN